MCVKLTSQAHPKPCALLLATKTESPHPQLFLQIYRHFTSGHPFILQPFLQRSPLASKDNHTMETKPFILSSIMQLRRVRWTANTLIELLHHKALEENIIELIGTDH